VFVDSYMHGCSAAFHVQSLSGSLNMCCRKTSALKVDKQGLPYKEGLESLNPNTRQVTGSTVHLLKGSGRHKAQLTQT
jgi:hypothetical protein